MQTDENILFADFPNFYITDDTIRDIKQNPQKYTGCVGRINKKQKKYITENLKRFGEKNN